MIHKIFIKVSLTATFLFLGAFLFAPTASAVTEVGGLVDGHWTADNSPYVVVFWATVPQGSTLTIDPGVVVKFKYRAGMTINGTLNVNGTTENKVYITSERDDTIGGDTNGDGSASSPWYGDWSTIMFNTGSSGNIQNTVIKYGGRSYGNIYNKGGIVHITGTEISHSLHNGVFAGSGDLFIAGSEIHGQERGLLVTDGTAIVADSTFYDFSLYAIDAGYSSTGTLDVTGSTFQDSGKAHVYMNNQVAFTHGNNITLGGSPAGGILMLGVLTTDSTWPADGLPYIIESTIVNPGATLTIDPGAILKMRYRAWMTINGALNVNGTEENKVYITSERDDTIGGDTNNDGSASSPGHGDWYTIAFNSGSSGNIQGAVIKYGGRSCTGCSYSNLYNNGGVLDITGSEITSSYAMGIRHDGGDMTVSGSSIYGNNTWGVYNQTIEDIDARNNWWGDPSGPYHHILNPAGTGNKVSDHVLFDPWLEQEPGEETGAYKVAVILADLVGLQHAPATTLEQPCKLRDQNRTYSTYTEYYDDMFHCVNDYYDENSYGTVQFEFEVFDDGGGWYDLPGTEADYSGKDDVTIQKLRDDAIQKAGSDMASSGPFDIRVVVHSSRSQSMYPSGPLFDVGYNYDPNGPKGVHISAYSGLGPWVHEFGHVVAPLQGWNDGINVFPDLYDRGNIRSWDVMATGYKLSDYSDPAGMSVATREAMGFLELDPDSEPGTFWINSVETAEFGDDLFMMNVDDELPLPNQFFVEARTNDPQYSTWDRSLPHDGRLILYYFNPVSGIITIPGNSILGTLLGIDNGILDPDTQESYLDFDNELIVTALQDDHASDGKYRIEASVEVMTQSQLNAHNISLALGAILRPDALTAIRQIVSANEQRGFVKGNPGSGIDWSSFDLQPAAINPGYEVTPAGIAASVGLTALGIFLIALFMFVAAKWLRWGISAFQKRILLVVKVSAIVAVVSGFAIIVMLPFKSLYREGLNVVWPYHFAFIDGNEDQSDLDLHVYCDDGRHVGMNYDTGEYEVEIDGTITNGDNLGAPEWIFFPPEPENASCRHTVSSYDNQKFLEENPDIAAQIPDTTDAYEIYARYIDPASGIFTSETLSAQTIMPGEYVTHAVSGTTDVSIDEGIIDDMPPATTVILSGTEGLNGWFLSEVEVSFYAEDNAGGLGVDRTEYSLDNGATWIEYDAPFGIADDGIHAVMYRSYDVVGNAEDTKTLEIKIDTTVPETSIPSGPSAETYLREAIFGLSSDEPDTTFTCSLDNSDFTLCESPSIYTNLAIGTHIFQAASTDEAGNSDPTPAEYTWTILEGGTIEVKF